MSVRKKIVIVGGSIAGGACASLLARQHDVTVVEEHSHFRKVCSGILTSTIYNSLKIPESVIENRVSAIRIHSPNGVILPVHFQQPDIICNREKLNEYVNKLAIENGASFVNSARFKSIVPNGVLIDERAIGERVISADILIGADGAQSSVAGASNLAGKRRFFVASQAFLKMEHDNVIDVFPHIGSFAWIVPRKKGVVEAGTLSLMGSQFNPFNNFISALDGKIISKEAALVPLYDRHIRTTADINGVRIYLIGDSATMVKATTGGSIVQSVRAAHCLSTAINNGGSYDLLWRKTIGRDLLLHYLMRKVFNRFSENDWNIIVGSLAKHNSRNIFEKNSRDTPSLWLLSMLIKKPSLIYRGVKAMLLG